MGKIVFECETVTPMFMYGADGKTPELRPASIKGIMRFWWRAIHGNSDIEVLREAESNIFGSTDRRSQVTVRVKPPKIEKENSITIEKLPKMDYLWYPFYLDNAEKEKSCIVDLKFDVILSSYDTKALKEASCAFILLSLFGGLGSRSRRGGGSFKIKGISDKSYTKKLSDMNKIKEIQKFANFNIKISSKGENSWDKALKKINDEYKKFRKNHKILDNASFGLPIIFEDKKKKIEVFTEPEFDRRASPLIIKVLKIEDKYHWMVVKLDGEFLPTDTELIHKENNQEKNRQTVDENIIDEFIRGLK